MMNWKFWCILVVIKSNSPRTQETLYISEYLGFGIYDWFVFKTNADISPSKFSWWLGVSHQVGRIMICCILPPSEIPIPCNTVNFLTHIKQQTYIWKWFMTTFYNKLDYKFQASTSDMSNPTKDISKDLLLYMERSIQTS